MFVSAVTGINCSTLSDPECNRSSNGNAMKYDSVLDWIDSGFDFDSPCKTVTKPKKRKKIVLYFGQRLLSADRHSDRLGFKTLFLFCFFLLRKGRGQVKMIKRDVVAALPLCCPFLSGLLWDLNSSIMPDIVISQWCFKVTLL